MSFLAAKPGGVPCNPRLVLRPATGKRSAIQLAQWTDLFHIHELKMVAFVGPFDMCVLKII